MKHPQLHRRPRNPQNSEPNRKFSRTQLDEADTVSFPIAFLIYVRRPGLGPNLPQLIGRTGERLGRLGAETEHAVWYGRRALEMHRLFSRTLDIFAPSRPRLAAMARLNKSV